MIAPCTTVRVEDETEKMETMRVEKYEFQRQLNAPSSYYIYMSWTSLNVLTDEPNRITKWIAYSTLAAQGLELELDKAYGPRLEDDKAREPGLELDKARGCELELDKAQGPELELDVVCTLLLESHMPSRFWYEALSITVQLINRLPSASLGNESSFTWLFGHPPDYSTLCIFGCVLCPSSSIRTNILIYSYSYFL
ncbi:hypothetical protein CR513_36706, partial [Mucuna pruriens]